MMKAIPLLMSEQAELPATLIVETKVTVAMMDGSQPEAVVAVPDAAA